MFKTKLLVVALGAAFALPALADEAAPAVTSNIGIVSDYIYRGLTQTSHSPAVQGGLDYAHGSGFYAGVWGSNVSWIVDGLDGTAVASGNKPTLELDTYFGLKGAIVPDVSFDVGAVRYNYLGNSYATRANSGLVNADTAEVYGAVGYKFLTFKYSYGVLDRFLMIPNAGGTSYMDLTAAYPIEGMGLTVTGHIGLQKYKGDFVNNSGVYAAGTTIDPSCTDYKLGVTKDFGGYVAGLTYTSTNVTTSAWTSNGEQWGKSTVAFSLTHAM